MTANLARPVRRTFGMNPTPTEARMPSTAAKRTLLRMGAVVAVLLAGACTSKSSTSTSAGATTTTAGTPVSLSGQTTNKGTVDATGKTSTEIEADNDGGQYYFKPTFVKLTAGTAVKIEVKNEGSLQHTFTIDSLHIDETIDAGKSATVTVTVPAGSSPVTYYCRFHQGSGMQGAFTVG